MASVSRLATSGEERAVGGEGGRAKTRALLEGHAVGQREHQRSGAHKEVRVRSPTLLAVLSPILSLNLFRASSLIFRHSSDNRCCVLFRVCVCDCVCVFVCVCVYAGVCRTRGCRQERAGARRVWRRGAAGGADSCGARDARGGHRGHPRGSLTATAAHLLSCC